MTAALRGMPLIERYRDFLPVFAERVKTRKKGREALRGVQADAIADGSAASSSLLARLLAELLGRQVRRLALHHAADARDVQAALRLGDAEVDDLHEAAGRHEDVRRRDVAVDEVQRPALRVAQLVRVVQPVEDVRGDAQRVEVRGEVRATFNDRNLPKGVQIGAGAVDEADVGCEEDIEFAEERGFGASCAFGDGCDAPGVRCEPVHNEAGVSK